MRFRLVPVRLYLICSSVRAVLIFSVIPSSCGSPWRSIPTRPQGRSKQDGSVGVFLVNRYARAVYPVISSSIHLVIVSSSHRLIAPVPHPGHDETNHGEGNWRSVGRYRIPHEANGGRGGEGRDGRASNKNDETDTRDEIQDEKRDDSGKPDETMRASGRSEQAGTAMRRDALRDERRDEERDDHRRCRARTNSGRQLVLSRAVFLSSLSFALSSGSPRRGRRLIVFVPRRCGLDGFLIISSGSSISSNHLIPSWSVSPAVSSNASRADVSHDMLGASTGREGRSKQANTKTRTRKRDEKPGSKTGRGRNERNKTTEMERGRNEDGKQAMKRRRGHTTQSRIRTKRPSHPFRPTPSPQVLVGSPASNRSPAPGAWDERMKMS